MSEEEKVGKVTAFERHMQSIAAGVALGALVWVGNTLNNTQTQVATLNGSITATLASQKEAIAKIESTLAQLQLATERNGREISDLAARQAADERREAVEHKALRQRPGGGL